jgi:hypothetical protein
MELYHDRDNTFQNVSAVVVRILECGTVCLLRGDRVPWFHLYFRCAAVVTLHIIVASIHTASDAFIRVIHFLSFHCQSSLVFYDYGIIICEAEKFIA